MKTINVLIEMLMSKFRILLCNFLRKFMKSKYGWKSDVCFISEDNHFLVFYTSLTQGRVPLEWAHLSIRKMVGENILHIHGIPLSEKDIPVIKLVVTLKAIKSIGIKSTYKLYKEWKGSSSVGKTVVVKYIR